MLLSSTKPRQPRHEQDVYLTPRVYVEKALDLVPGEPASILDIGAGEGIWGEVARERWPVAFIEGVEVRDAPKPDAYNRWTTGDIREVRHLLRANYQLVCGNPPFSIAEDVVRIALAHLAFGGVAVFLLRLAFLESKTRAQGLFREFPPELVVPSATRPKFYGGKNGVTAMAFYRWRKGHDGPTRLIWAGDGRT